MNYLNGKIELFHRNRFLKHNKENDVDENKMINAILHDATKAYHSTSCITKTVNQFAKGFNRQL